MLKKIEQNNELEKGIQLKKNVIKIDKRLTDNKKQIILNVTNAMKKQLNRLDIIEVDYSGSASFNQGNNLNLGLKS